MDYSQQTYQGKMVYYYWVLLRVTSAELEKKIKKITDTKNFRLPKCF